MTEAAKHTPTMDELIRAGLVERVEAQARLIESLTKALEDAYATFEFMSSAAIRVGLEGTSQWDEVSGGSGMYRTVSTIRTALASAQRAKEK